MLMRHNVFCLLIPFRSVSFHSVPFHRTCTFSKFQHIEYKLNGAIGGTFFLTEKCIYHNNISTQICIQNRTLVHNWAIWTNWKLAYNFSWNCCIGCWISNANQCYFGTAQTFRHSCQLVTTNMYGAIFAEFASCSLSRIKTVWACICVEIVQFAATFEADQTTFIAAEDCLSANHSAKDTLDLCECWNFSSSNSGSHSWHVQCPHNTY